MIPLARPPALALPPLLLAATFAVAAELPAAALPLKTPAPRLLPGFDGLPLGMGRSQVSSSLSRRDALKFEVVGVPGGEEVRYRTVIGDLPFDVFLQFERGAGWRRAVVQLAGSTFGQNPQQCAGLFERVLYLVSLQHGTPDERSTPLPTPVLYERFTQHAEYRFTNPATLTVHNRFDASTCYNYVVIDGSPQRTTPSTF